MVSELIAKAAKREFSQALLFDDTERPCIRYDSGKSLRLLYLHIPFCESLCPYCSFNRIAFEEKLCRRYFKALRKEIRLYKKSGYDFGAIYLGGGTPTILIDELLKTIDLAESIFSIREISVETNPNHLTAENLALLKHAGVNRLSVGIQSFDDELLKAMGRYHKYGSGTEIAERIRKALGKFHTVNADMIFNFPSQTEESLSRDIEILRSTGVDQVTYYPLMVSDSTKKAISQNLGTVDFSRERKYYSMITNALLPAYRFSSAWCFSKKDAMIDEYIVDYDEYAGLGSGSIGYMNGTCYANTFSINEYIDKLEKGEIPLMASRTFGCREQMRYDFMMKLFGLDLPFTLFADKYRRTDRLLLIKDILPFVLTGALRYSNGRLRLTRRGRYFWVVMMREFFSAVNNFRDYCLAKKTK
ncbi:MAG: coproporphyrinogen III oxidase family protein [Syntrophales bacterium]|jgi:coproporphyrinogen III oxidase-like Fe-S oxidoreductase|nr:coproporphyrinogen III oxidase family protein [Syntrophales bacterium]MDY0043319.1 coproporphyrinogen III oxidase family protein [Syntrophales bacterium]